MKTVGQKLERFNVVGVKPGFNRHEENGISKALPGVNLVNLSGLSRVPSRGRARTCASGHARTPGACSRFTGSRADANC